MRAALLTPHGVAAIAIIAFRSESWAELLASRLVPRGKHSLSQTPIGGVRVADWRHDAQGAHEEIVFTRREANLLEIQCHGGHLAAESISRTLSQLGVAVLAAQEWALAEEACPIRAAAQLALSQTSAIQPTRILLDQFRGALRRELERAIAELDQDDALSCLARLQILVDRSRVGLKLHSGFRVALLGQPNVGKSSLLNSLLGFGRAIVLDEPGTTRDLLTAEAAFGGWPVTLQDMAGIRESLDPIEAEGVRRAQEAARSADLVLIVCDASQPTTGADLDLISAHRHALVLLNKSDLEHRQHHTLTGIPVSAKTGAGLKTLEAAMLDRLLRPRLAPGDAVPFETPQVTAITRAIGYAKAGDRVRASQELLHLLSRQA